MSKPIQKVLVLGSAALKIGEAGEFDYSGSQAIKAFKDEGVATILVNPNIATIQTSEELADHVYFLPVTPYFVERIIQKEKPNGIVLGFGGQTALNCGMALEEQGILKKFNVEVLGTPIRAIRETEDRGIFTEKLSEIGVMVPKSAAVSSVEDAHHVAEALGFPVMLRIAYALGGLGSGMCESAEELDLRVKRAFHYTNQVLIEECLTGWKEVEYEIVRDQFDNCVAVCNMENFDSMGIHTGESIVVAPSQTLNNKEYHALRDVAVRIARHIGIIGECNVQFALHRGSNEYRVIEMNARLSRSSALASKATGYPLAYIAAKLGLGHHLAELPNPMNGVTQACFEPALDYVVVKMPRWDLKKFHLVSKKIGSAMKSVGEVMAIGRTFEEALQKALRMLDIGVEGVIEPRNHLEDAEIERELQAPTPERIFVIAEGIRRGWPIDRIFQLSHVDPWFLHKIQQMVSVAQDVQEASRPLESRDLLVEAKRTGLSDRLIARLIQVDDVQVRECRKRLGIQPNVKQIDTLAAEYPARSNYLYLTYHGDEDDIAPDSHFPSVLVLGSGAYRIGSSVEFDWCCVSTVQTLQALGYRTIMLNCNPETVSTDYNECEALYFEELSVETILEICAKEQPLGVIVSMGGQTPNNLVLRLAEAGVPILGTWPQSIDQAEDRHKFSTLLDTLGIKQPEWRELTGLDEARAFADQVGYPVLVRPSYVLSGATMGVASNETELLNFVKRAVHISKDHPVVISKFIENAKELEMDGVVCEGKLILSAISEHVENAGVHSGDATLVFPPQRTYLETMRRIKKVSAQIAEALHIHGPCNIQFIAKDNDVQVIECNLRASRSVPFVSKIAKTNLIQVATNVMMNTPVTVPTNLMNGLEYVGVKAPQFSFTRLEGADPATGVEMASTGEVACLGDDFEEAFLKALLSVGYQMSLHHVLLSTGPIEAKADFLECAGLLMRMGVRLTATPGTSEFLQENQIESTKVYWPTDDHKPNVLDFLATEPIDLVINIPKNVQRQELTNDYRVRRKAVDLAIPLITNLQMAERFIESVSRKTIQDLQIKSWGEYV